MYDRTAVFCSHNIIICIFNELLYSSSGIGMIDGIADQNRASVGVGKPAILQQDFQVVLIVIAGLTICHKHDCRRCYLSGMCHEAILGKYQIQLLKSLAIVGQTNAGFNGMKKHLIHRDILKHPFCIGSKCHDGDLHIQTIVGLDLFQFIHQLCKSSIHCRNSVTTHGTACIHYKNDHHQFSAADCLEAAEVRCDRSLIYAKWIISIKGNIINCQS